VQAYEGLVTATTLKEEYIFVTAKVKEVYLYHLLSSLAELEVRSVIVFVSTCKGCRLLDLLLQELEISCVALHSHKSQGGRLAAMDRYLCSRFPYMHSNKLGMFQAPAADLSVLTG